MTTKKVVLIVVGILSALALVVALVAGGILGFVFYSLDHSDAAQTAKTFLRQNERLKQDIGEVQDFGWFTTGSVNAQNSTGNAELHLKTVGARASVNSTVVLAYRSGHEWRVVDAFYDNAAGQRIYLTKNFDAAADTPSQNEEGNADESDDADNNTNASDDTDVSDDDQKFDEESFAADVLKSDEPVLVVLGSPSSPDSVELDKTLDEIAPKYEKRASLVRYNLSEQPELFRRFEVKQVPTLILFKNGVEAERHAGRLPASEITSLLDKHLE
ncbi:MAG: thioredoxin 1 [Acidobacteriota bacterium]|jgi:thioredoxin 1|nr:thioredoxin 1 [Acidobacteriota bacterium]